MKSGSNIDIADLDNLYEEINKKEIVEKEIEKKTVIINSRDPSQENFIIFSPKSFNDNQSKWKIHISIHPDDLPKAWGLLMSNSNTLGFLMKNQFKVTKHKDLKNMIDLFDHYEKNTTLEDIKKRSEDIEFIKKMNMFVVIMQILLNFDLDLNVSKLNDNQKKELSQKYQILVQIFYEMSEQNSYSCSTFKSNGSILDIINFFLIPRDEKTSSFVYSPREEKYVKAVIKQSTGITLTKEEQASIDNYPKSYPPNDDINQLKNSFNRVYQGAQITVHNTIQSQQDGGADKFIDNVDKLFRTNNIRSGTKPESDTALNSFCSTRNESSDIGDRNLPFYSISAQVNPATNLFFYKIVNNWIGNATSDTSDLRNEIGYKLKRLQNNNWQDLKEIQALITLLQKPCGDYFIKFVLHALHFLGRIDHLNKNEQLDPLYQIEENFNPILQMLHQHQNETTKEFTLKIIDILNGKNPAIQSDPAIKLQLIEDAFDYLHVNNQLQLYKTQPSSRRKDQYQTSALLQNHLKALKNAYVVIVKNNSTNNDVIRLAKTSRLVNFNRTRYQFFFKETTKTRKEINEILSSPTQSTIKPHHKGAVKQ